MAVVFFPLLAHAGSASWAHQTGTLNSNGSVTVKSLSGGSYAATQNPSGAIAKSNQNAATQPPTVIIQATSGAVFNYTTDCYYFRVGSTSQEVFGIGKMDSSNKFTGLVAKQNSVAAGYLIATSIGGGNPVVSTNLTPLYAGSSGDAVSGGVDDRLIVAVSMPTVLVAPVKCYP